MTANASYAGFAASDTRAVSFAVDRKWLYYPLFLSYRGSSIAGGLMKSGLETPWSEFQPNPDVDANSPSKRSNSNKWASISFCDTIYSKIIPFIEKRRSVLSFSGFFVVRKVISWTKNCIEKGSKTFPNQLLVKSFWYYLSTNLNYSNVILGRTLRMLRSVKFKPHHRSKSKK